MKINNIQPYQSSPKFQGSRDKFIEKIINSNTPKKIKILADDVERICESLGFSRNKKRGSHMSFKISETENISFVTPHNNKKEITATDKVKLKQLLQRFYKKTKPDDENSLDLTV